MASLKLTAANVAKAALPDGQSDIVYFDEDIPGFGLRVREGGGRSWVYQYKFNGKDRKMTFGTVSAMVAGKARETAGQLHAQVKLGRDPASEKVAAKVRSGDTFAVAVEAFLKWQKVRLKPRSYLETERYLNKHSKPLHKLGLSTADQPRVAQLLATVSEKNGAIASNRCRAALSAFFTWSMKSGRMPAVTNPAEYTNRNDEVSRDRVLDAAELKAIWAALPEGDYGDIVRLLMLTAARREEFGSVAWSEIADGAITVPAGRSKNGEARFIPLSGPARAILEARQKVDGRDLIFGRGAAGFSGWSACKARLDVALGSSVKPWRVHDLRRTARSEMGRLGVAPHIAELVLGHRQGGIAAVYDRYRYEPEIGAALTLWAEHLMDVVEGRTAVVVPMRKPAG